MLPLLAFAVALQAALGGPFKALTLCRLPGICQPNCRSCRVMIWSFATSPSAPRGNVLQLPWQGEVTRCCAKEPWQVRAIFLQNCAPWAITPNTPQHHLRDPLLRYRSGQRRITINPKNYSRRASTTLENFTNLKPATIIN